MSVSTDNAIVLTARSGRAALKHRLSVLGVETEPKSDKVYEEFLNWADRKKDINDDDVLMLAGRPYRHAPYQLDYLWWLPGVGLQSVTVFV